MSRWVVWVVHVVPDRGIVNSRLSDVLRVVLVVLVDSVGQMNSAVDQVNQFLAFLLDLPDHGVIAWPIGIQLECQELDAVVVVCHQAVQLPLQLRLAGGYIWPFLVDVVVDDLEDLVHV